MDMEEIRALRHTLHGCPEPSGQEDRTRAMLMKNTLTAAKLHQGV